jgi:hypothetical protein
MTRSHRKLQAACDAFNAVHPIGSTIRVFPGDIRGRLDEVQIIEPGAYVLSAYTAVVQVTGGHRCIALSHVWGSAITAPQSEAKATHTPGPWGFIPHTPRSIDLLRDHWEVGQVNAPNFGCAIVFGSEANARLIAASWDLLQAAQLLENAEAARCGCDECEDEGEPECCSKCFPLFDDARVKRRLAIAKALGAQL